MIFNILLESSKLKYYTVLNKKPYNLNLFRNIIPKKGHRQTTTGESKAGEVNGDSDSNFEFSKIK